MKAKKFCILGIKQKYKLWFHSPVPHQELKPCHLSNLKLLNTLSKIATELYASVQGLGDESRVDGTSRGESLRLGVGMENSLSLVRNG
jgi:hypothetical protein